MMPTAPGEWAAPPTQIDSQEPKRYHLVTDDREKSSKFLPNYDAVSPCRLIDLLTDSIPPEDRPQIDGWLSHATLLQYIRKLAKLICAYSQLCIEEDYWNCVARLNIPEVSTAFAKQNSIGWDHTKTKANIEHQQNLIRTGLQEAKRNAATYARKVHLYAWITLRPDKTTLRQSMLILLDSIRTLVQRSLFYFRTNFQQKLVFLKFSLQAVQMTKAFYDLNPNAEQVTSHLFYHST